MTANSMSLTVALGMLGLAVLLVIVVHGAWRTWRARPRRASEAAPSRLEPTLLDDAAESAAISGDDPLPLAPALKRTARIDALIDAIAPLTVDAPVSGELALAHLPASRRAGQQVLHIEGLNSETGEWEALSAGQSYGEFQAGVQLANRAGRLNEIEYSEFVQKVQEFADAVGAMPDFPDMLDAVARARELDAFARQVDAQLTVHLRAKGSAWSVAYLQQIAARHGFVAGPVPGRLIVPGDDDEGVPVLQLAFDAQLALAEDPNQATLRRVELTLDVPHTAEAQEPFPAWHRAATALTGDLNATLVDDQEQPVTLHAFAAIGNDLAQLYRALDGHGLAAGSGAARRLFS